MLAAGQRLSAATCAREMSGLVWKPARTIVQLSMCSRVGIPNYAKKEWGIGYHGRITQLLKNTQWLSFLFLFCSQESLEISWKGRKQLRVISLPLLKNPIWKTRMGWQIDPLGLRITLSTIWSVIKASVYRRKWTRRDWSQMKPGGDWGDDYQLTTWQLIKACGMPHSWRWCCPLGPYDLGLYWPGLYRNWRNEETLRLYLCRPGQRRQETWPFRVNPSIGTRRHCDQWGFCWIKVFDPCWPTLYN